MAHYRRPLATGVALNTGIIVVEAVADMALECVELLAKRDALPHAIAVWRFGTCIAARRVCASEGDCSVSGI